MSIAKLENIHKVYHIGKIDFPALRGISFSIEEGEFLSIAGPSGSGKTTILNLLGCLDKPSQGKIFLEEKDITALPTSKLADVRRKNIGFVFQTFNLIPVLTAMENVEFPLILEGQHDPKERRQVTEDILTEVGLKDFLHRRPNEMSGGQQQRVAVARALVKKPKLVLADEPTANLDSVTGEEILQLMLELNQKTSTTFVFSTHDKMVMDFARRIIRLRDGKIESDQKVNKK
ncbi:MAG: ATP-binding cassette domain-containing protein [Candidatus Aminicenantes bacterium]|nr:ATP-binding cassette domain-containing protein [Candidatus Aminicenantes bacterium]